MAPVSQRRTLAKQKNHQVQAALSRDKARDRAPGRYVRTAPGRPYRGLLVFAKHRSSGKVEL